MVRSVSRIFRSARLRDGRMLKSIISSGEEMTPEV